ncbi:membrane protein [Alkalihalobacillus alcalophilus ATCC 27647 = CGMCC 1.3604]|uniref:Membrane protein n=1 Tax=Alkalihalobacillus alcalophilus ATCC 27647 = CGMCC 1.3604 TaxID=1218173 RepID=A0A094WJ72_ALKAL|nr:DUF1294 domain-containing protein [Alkalihalobacillus alcalophilus]KGA97829.1 membrane protein [Alkalihalobacillus alcalophilus ATCC 27647 = CGMCC 1.3604]MED1563894.1 DUF1294 domain-containing protein [Alkalihalobacillus alcalophilus]THG90232.1 membrane protein [Alkalihalobacillus alcalophilus ATCC 27647 = CGMCC 1.3604]
MMPLLLMYLVMINFIGYTTMAQDKRKAQRKERRIPEKTLFFIAIIGGSFGVFNAMKVYRHKTKHKSFTVGIPLILFVQFFMVIFIFLGERT